jgi:AraC family transcriptional activator of pyochelin receptor
MSKPVNRSGDNFDALFNNNKGAEHAFQMSFGKRQGDVRLYAADGFTVVDAKFAPGIGSVNWSHENDQSLVEMNFVLEGRLDQSHSGLLRKQPYTTGYHNCLYNPNSLEENGLLCGKGFQMISIHLEPAEMKRLLLSYAPELETFAQDLEENKPFLCQAPVLDLPLRIKFILRNLWESPVPAGLKRLYFESVVLQLLCYQCEQLFPLKQLTEPASVKLSERDKLFHARDILLARLGDPPALSVLARECQSNEFSLKKGFKELFGTTVFGFVLQERMKNARYALHVGEKTISEIAYELGYAHPQHFHRVFKKCFGLTPQRNERILAAYDRKFF